MRLCGHHGELGLSGLTHVWQLHPVTNLTGGIVAWVAACDRCREPGYSASLENVRRGA